MAGDASFHYGHDVTSWDSDPENGLDGADYEWLIDVCPALEREGQLGSVDAAIALGGDGQLSFVDGDPALYSRGCQCFGNVDGVDPVWYNGGQRFDNDGDAELSSNGHHICDYVDPVSSSGGQQVYDEIGSIPDDRNRLHQCKVHSTMLSGVDVWAGP